MTSPKERKRLLDTLHGLGFSYDEAAALRRIAMTLSRWHELECGVTGDMGEQSTLSVERETEEPDSQPYKRLQYPTRAGYVDRRWKVPDLENNALKRLARIVANCNAGRTNGPLSYYVQTDPRGLSLYILRPGDVPEGSTADESYNRGVGVY